MAGCLSTDMVPIITPQPHTLNGDAVLLSLSLCKVCGEVTMKAAGVDGMIAMTDEGRLMKEMKQASEGTNAK